MFRRFSLMVFFCFCLMALVTGSLLASPSHVHAQAHAKTDVLYRGGTAANGDDLIQAYNPHTGAVLWSKKLNGNISSVGMHTAKDLIFAQKNGLILKVAPEDGHTIWEKQIGRLVAMRYFPEQDIVIATTIDNHMYAFNGKNGEERWQVAVPACGADICFTMPQLISGKSLYAYVGEIGLHSFSLKDGSVNWQNQEIAYGPETQNMETYRGLIFATAKDGGVIAFNEQGKIVHRFASQNPSEPTYQQAMRIVDCKLYLLEAHIAGFNMLMRYDLNTMTGAPDWSVKLDQPVSLTEMVVDNGRIYAHGAATFVNTGDSVAMTASFDATNGKLLWQWKKSSRTTPFWTGTPLIFSGHLFLDNVTHLYVLDPATGQDLWEA